MAEPETLQPNLVASGGTEEFVGPFASWLNVQTQYGARGDGTTDDTAAIQRALNAVGAAGASGGPAVVYLPPGTYRITAALTMASRISVGVIGADPATTVLKWDGPAGAPMLDLNGVAYSQFERLTFNGAGTRGNPAQTGIMQAWDGQRQYAATDNRYTDDIFENMAYGMRIGSRGYMDSEGTIRRCRFVNLSSAGISVENFNALDWWVWNSDFEHDAVGVSDASGPGGRGAGNFHVYDSVFRGSTTSDILIGNTCYFSFRRNVSVGSAHFVVAGPIGSSPNPMTLQGNAVLNPTGSPAVDVWNPGPVLLVDNIFKTATTPVVHVQEPYVPNATSADVVSVGNTFTVLNPYKVAGRLATTDDRQIAAAYLNPAIPAPATALPNWHRTVFDVPAGASAAVIQNAINQAAQLNGQHPVVHLPAGTYNLTSTLTIPASTDVQLAGDGDRTVVAWAGSLAPSVLHLPGPSHATILDLQIMGGSAGDAILADNTDQIGARVFSDQNYLAGASRPNQTGLLVNGVQHVHVLLENLLTESDATGLKVVGSGAPNNGTSLDSRVDVFGGAAGSEGNAYDLSNQGRLMVQDAWYEGGGAGFTSLTGAGTFTLDGAMVAATTASATTINVNNFAGKAVVLGTVLFRGDTIGLSGQGNGTNFLGLGVTGVVSSFSSMTPYFANSMTTAQSALMNSKHEDPTSASQPVPNQVQNVTDMSTYLRTMLAQLRNEQPEALNALPASVTDLRLYRVDVSPGTVGIEVK